jgi:hypothetical protein
MKHTHLHKLVKNISPDLTDEEIQKIIFHFLEYTKEQENNFY